MAEILWSIFQFFLFALVAIFIGVFVANEVELPKEYASMPSKSPGLVADLLDKASKINNKIYEVGSTMKNSFEQSSLESILDEPLPERLTLPEMRKAREELEEYKNQKDKRGYFAKVYNAMASVMTYSFFSGKL